LFPTIVSTKKADGKTYRYLHIVESYRDGKTVKKRRIASLGNIDEYSDKEIEQIILKLNSLLQHRVMGSLKDLESKATLHFGIPYVVRFLWDQFDLTKAIREALKEYDVAFDVSGYVQAMVINRLINPSSKVNLFDTIEDIYLPNVSDKWQLQHFYQALDYLVDIKPQLERFLYHRLTDLFNLQLSLVFYDLTTTHFSGHHCPVAKNSYSRTYRPDPEQIDLGLLVTPEGLPITHEVFSKETTDKKIVPKILKRLKEEFDIKQCVFVGDHGMVTDKNILMTPYIVGYHKRGRIVSDTLLQIYADIQAYAKLKDDFSFLEVPVAQVEDDNKDSQIRYILCYNPLKAIRDKAYRMAAMDEAEKVLSELRQRLAKSKRKRKSDTKGTLAKVSEILTKKGVKGFFEVECAGQHLTYSRHEPALEKEALRDGKFVLKTNTGLPAEEVVLSYRNLMDVKCAFREINNFLEVGSMLHWNTKRVEGHSFICVLAYLLEQELQLLYQRHWQMESEQALKISDEDERTAKQVELMERRFTGEGIVKELARWNVLKGEFLGKEFLSIPPPTAMAQKILSIGGIPLPSKIIYLD